jgi:hypothetical protein
MLPYKVRKRFVRNSKRGGFRNNSGRKLGNSSDVIDTDFPQTSFDTVFYVEGIVVVPQEDEDIHDLAVQRDVLIPLLRKMGLDPKIVRMDKTDRRSFKSKRQRWSHHRRTSIVDVCKLIYDKPGQLAETLATEIYCPRKLVDGEYVMQLEEWTDGDQLAAEYKIRRFLYDLFHMDVIAKTRRDEDGKVGWLAGAEYDNYMKEQANDYL